jgi:hypothetical protein
MPKYTGDIQRRLDALEARVFQLLLVLLAGLFGIIAALVTVAV